MNCFTQNPVPLSTHPHPKCKVFFCLFARAWQKVGFSASSADGFRLLLGWFDEVDNVHIRRLAVRVIGFGLSEVERFGQLSFALRNQTKAILDVLDRASRQRIGAPAEWCDVPDDVAQSLAQLAQDALFFA